MTSSALDKLDRAICCACRRMAAPCEAIGEQVGLSASAVLRRVKRLEDSGVIERTVALVRPEAVGLGLVAYVNVRLEKHQERQAQPHGRVPRQRADLARGGGVRLADRRDGFCCVVVAGHGAYSALHHGHAAHPSVQDCKTSFVMDRVKSTTALPI
jgi:Lrp/AsnC family leucine-responsive transcriptional regulator